MLKKTITFDDLDGNPITEDFYFNLTKAEITEMELSEAGGLAAHMTKIVAENDGKKLVELFKDLIVRSVGKRDIDGRKFVKNDSVVNDFIQTNAYSELFMELATKSDAAVAFITGIVPKDLNVDTAEIDKIKAQTEANLSGQSTEKLELPSSETSRQKYERLLSDPNWKPNANDLREMDKDQLQLAFARQAG